MICCQSRGPTRSQACEPTQPAKKPRSKTLLKELFAGSCDEAHKMRFHRSLIASLFAHAEPTAAELTTLKRKGMMIRRKMLKRTFWISRQTVRHCCTSYLQFRGNGHGKTCTESSHRSETWQTARLSRDQLHFLLVQKATPGGRQSHPCYALLRL